MASTKATELAQLSRKLTYNEATDDAIIPTGTILTTGDSTDDLQEGLSNLYFTDARARASVSGGTGVTYDSGTGVISIGQAVGTTDSVTFDAVTLNTLNFGSDTSLSWNSVDGTLDVTLGDATLQLGQEQYFYAKATEDIANGDVVMFAGAQGDHALIAKADMTAPGFFPEAVMGVATEEILNNEFGYVTTFGKVRGVDLSTLQNGDLLYLSSTVPGALVTTAPSFPDHAILLTAVLDNKVNGTMLVRLTHISDFDELHNVSITSAASGDFISWDGTNWVNIDPDTDDIDEGATNLYYTTARVKADETTTSLSIANNILTYTDEDGGTTDIDLSLYLDDTNLARLVSGTVNSSTGIATFTRDDATTFTVDFSALLKITSIDQLSDVDISTTAPTTGQVLKWDGSKFVPASDEENLTNNDTDDLAEGSTNLYYTDGRVQAVVTQTYINNLNVDADTVDGRHYDDIISEATALAIALG